MNQLSFDGGVHQYGNAAKYEGFLAFRILIFIVDGEGKKIIIGRTMQVSYKTYSFFKPSNYLC